MCDPECNDEADATTPDPTVPTTTLNNTTTSPITDGDPMTNGTPPPSESAAYCLFFAFKVSSAC